MFSDNSIVVRAPARSGMNATCSFALGDASAASVGAGVEAEAGADAEADAGDAEAGPARAHTHMASPPDARTRLI